MGLFGFFHVLNTIGVAIVGSVKDNISNQNNKDQFRIEGTNYYIDSYGKTRGIYDNKVYLIQQDPQNNRRIVLDTKGRVKEIIYGKQYKGDPKNRSTNPVDENEYNDPNIQFYKIYMSEDESGRSYFGQLYINKKTGNICVKGEITYGKNKYDEWTYVCYYNIKNKLMEWIDPAQYYNCLIINKDFNPTSRLDDAMDYYNNVGIHVDVHRRCNYFVLEEQINEWKNRAK